MDIPKAGTLHGGMSYTLTQENSDGDFSGSSVGAVDPQPQMTSQEYNQASATPISNRNVDVSSKADDADQGGYGNSSKAQKRPLPDDSDTEPQLRKIMKSVSIAVSKEPATLEECVESLVKVITDPDSTDADIAEAKSLISRYGADKLSRSTVSFPISGAAFYPAITPFALACRQGKLDLVKALFVNQEQLDQTFYAENGTNGRTALMLAIINRHANVVEQLLAWGASTQIIDEENNHAGHLNMAFSYKSDTDTYMRIEELLTNYRKERGLPPFIKPDASIMTVDNCDGTVVRNTNRYNPDMPFSILLDIIKFIDGQ